MTEQRLKPKDVAQLWQCSTTQVLTLIRSGRLRAFNIGCKKRARYVIDPAEVERFEKGQDTALPVLRRPRKKTVYKHLRVLPNVTPPSKPR